MRPVLRDLDGLLSIVDWFCEEEMKLGGQGGQGGRGGRGGLSREQEARIEEEGGRRKPGDGRRGSGIREGDGRKDSVVERVVMEGEGGRRRNAKAKRRSVERKLVAIEEDLKTWLRDEAEDGKGVVCGGCGRWMEKAWVWCPWCGKGRR